MTTRVRFAPSPTGTLHLGSARSALYNWLYARHRGGDGTYVLRIEDTDVERSTPEHVEQALRVFRWLGLDWDEGPGVDGPYGPYFQSQRADLYRQALAQLVESGHAYQCFCTRAQLEEDRRQAEEAKQPFVYGGRCRELAADTVRGREQAGEQFVIRFRAPRHGATVVDDMILGESSFDNALIGDFVIARGDGTPLYNFANVVDDLAMHITHVIRGNDHLSNTPRQIMIYEALGERPPRFAHVPMILGPDGAKLSKRRHHTANVEQLAHEGYVPEAVRNGLALLGWAKDESTNVMTTEEMVRHFDVAKVRKSPAAIDYDKLRWLNGQHLRLMSPERFAEAFDAWRREWIAADEVEVVAASSVTAEQAAYLCQEKVDVLSQVPGLVRFLAEPFGISDQAWERLTAIAEAAQVLDAVVPMLESCDTWKADSIEQVLRDACTRLALKPRVVFAPIRFAVTGSTVSPGLFESLSVLGRERSIERLRSARARLEPALQRD